MALTQARGFGAHSGGRYGSFAGKGAGAHPVGILTQPLAFGAHSGRRYGSFAGKSGGSTHPVDRLTQAYAFGAHSGRRYGSFAGKAIAVPPVTDVSIPSSRRIEFPPGLRLEEFDDDELLLLLAARALFRSPLH